MNTPKLGAEPCPRCGCWMIRHVNCNCGTVHADSCLNCGRWTAPTLAKDEHTVLSEFDTVCGLGHIEHTHVKTLEAP